MEKICENCKHWKRRGVCVSWGDCLVLDGDDIMSEDGHYDDLITTGEYFGCIYFKEKKDV